MCAACRFCLLVDLVLSPLGIASSLSRWALRTHARGVVEIARPHRDIVIRGLQHASTREFPQIRLGNGPSWHARARRRVHGSGSAIVEIVRAAIVVTLPGTWARGVCRLARCRALPCSLPPSPCSSR